MHHHKSKRSNDHTASGTEETGTRAARWLLPVPLVAQLMVILDITAVNIALPHIATDLHLSGSQISWTITSYSLVFGSLLLFGGRAADLLGRRRLFLTGLGVFTTASLASALAGTATALFAARASQGVGAAMLSPAALSIITTCFHGHAKAKALAAWGAVGGAGAAIGVLAGGLLAAFTVLETHTKTPLLKIRRLGDRAVGGGLFLMLAAAGSIFGLFYLCSVYLQNVLGTSPLMTGLAFIPLALAAGVGAHAAGHVVGRHGVRVPLASAFAIATVGMALLAHVGADGTYLRNVLPGMLVAGFGLGIAVVSVSIAILTGARETEAGMISGLNSTGHEIGGTIGIAIFSTIAAGSGVLAGPQAAAGIAHAFIAAAVLASVASLVSIAFLT